MSEAEYNREIPGNKPNDWNILFRITRDNKGEIAAYNWKNFDQTLPSQNTGNCIGKWIGGKTSPLFDYQTLLF